MLRRSKTSLRWKLTVGFNFQTPLLWAFADTFAEALETAKTIEWGFEAADGGEPGLTRTVDLPEEVKQELAEWLDRMTILREDEAEKRESVTFPLGTGYYTLPSGSSEGAQMELQIRRLRKHERAHLARAAPDT